METIVYIFAVIAPSTITAIVMFWSWQERKRFYAAKHEALVRIHELERIVERDKIDFDVLLEEFNSDERVIGDLQKIVDIQDELLEEYREAHY